MCFSYLPKQDVELKQLIRRFDEISDHLAMNYQLGFTCETSRDAVLYSLELLGEHVLLATTTNERESRRTLRVKSAPSSSVVLFECGMPIGKCLFMHSVLG